MAKTKAVETLPDVSAMGPGADAAALLDSGWNFEFNSFIIFGLILLCGIIGGELARRGKYTPRITGYILAGLLIGPHVADIINETMLKQARFLVDIALGIIIFKISSLIVPADIFRRKRTFYTAVAEAALTFGALFFGLTALGMSSPAAALAAAIGVSSSPAVLLLVTRELGTSGKLTHHSLNIVALNNLTSFLMFLVVLMVVQVSQEASIADMFLVVLRQFAGAAVLAFVLAGLASKIVQMLVKSDDLANMFPIFIGMIVLAIGLAQMFAVSTLFTIFCLGLFSFNERGYETREKRDHLIDRLFDHGHVFYIILFVIAGASLHLKELAEYGLLALAFVGCRWAGKLAAMALAGGLLQISMRQVGYLSMMLMPMAGMAIGLTQTTEHLLPELSKGVAAVIFAAVAILETMGPIMTEYALKKSGEMPEDKAADH
ncbi:MAG: cation:proton antiporter [Bdellovibrionales bacterium]